MPIRMNFVMFCIMLPFAVWSIEPDERLLDPALEERARDISKNIRCLVCQNESIDESNSELAGDLRIVIREKITEGFSDREVYEYIKERYGEFALFKPSLSITNVILYSSSPGLLILFFWMAIRKIKKRNLNNERFNEILNQKEQAELKDLITKKRKL